jgi:uncharacterized membrane-anchored protein YhcB (DUF1043 family)
MSWIETEIEKVKHSIDDEARKELRSHFWYLANLFNENKKG